MKLQMYRIKSLYDNIKGFRNGWGVIIINLGEEPFEIVQGDRIAQAVFHKFETIEWEEVEKLTDSERGLTGFGDSGKK
jgi:dUTP pyrophosphatase